ncbi:MAG: DUF559 domain-containing protein [Pseudolabrys sp.]|jgi:very-short-patch-repair endonuclease
MTERRTISRFKRETARRLRREATQAEMLLWSHLKHLDMHGSHFRRQMPIGSYIVDFACPAARLIVEVDGSQHGTDSGRSRDSERTAWLNAEGYRLLRFWNSEVARDIDAVMEVIYAELYGAMNAEPQVLKHARRRCAGSATTPPRRAPRADPPPPGEGGSKEK